jgi:hypothetical protein
MDRFCMHACRGLGTLYTFNNIYDKGLSTPYARGFVIVKVGEGFSEALLVSDACGVP